MEEFNPCPQPSGYVQNAPDCTQISVDNSVHLGTMSTEVAYMSRVFAYARVSKESQTTENQLGEIRAAGFNIEARRITTENISGSVAAMQRPGFAKLVDKLEDGDVLIVTKLDRLGRNAMDVRQTVESLAKNGVRVHCLALGGVDLTSPAGKMTMQVINAVAEFERDLLIERTNSGIARAKAEGKHLGRKWTIDAEERSEVARRLNNGASVSAVAREFKTTRQTIIRVRNLELAEAG